MYIDENNPKYIFDDIFALLLHFNEYTSLIIFIQRKKEKNRHALRQCSVIELITC